MNKLIAIFGCESGAGRKTVARELARQWGDAGKAVLCLVIGFDKDAAVQSPHAGRLEEWIARFKSLSPVMLRNYLSADGEGTARLDLPAFPPVAVFRDLLDLLRPAFEWTLVSAPSAFSPEGRGAARSCRSLSVDRQAGTGFAGILSSVSGRADGASLSACAFAGGAQSSSS